MESEFVSLLVSDSRGRGIISKPLPPIHDYTSENIIIPGATIERLKLETKEFLKHNDPLKNRVFIIKLAAGICEITNREFHAGGLELSLRPRTNALANIKDFKNSISSLGLKTLISLVTIPPVSFVDNYNYNVSKGKLRNPKYSDINREDFQSELFSIRKIINDEIILENTKDQYISGIGICRSSQLLWHLNIIKTSKRRKSSPVITRIPHNYLPDGVHPNETIITKWSESLQQSVTQDIIQIKKILTK